MSALDRGQQPARIEPFQVFSNHNQIRCGAEQFLRERERLGWRCDRGVGQRALDHDHPK
jgi:hypothetical protein